MIGCEMILNGKSIGDTEMPEDVFAALCSNPSRFSCPLQPEGSSEASFNTKVEKVEAFKIYLRRVS